MSEPAGQPVFPTMTWERKEDAPGGDDALRKGCRCAVYDNWHGARGLHPDGFWYIREDCPIHGANRREEE